MSSAIAIPNSGSAIDVSGYSIPPSISNPKKRAFLQAYARLGTTIDAAPVAGVGHWAAYAWYRDDPGFRKARDEADEFIREMAEQIAAKEADRRAIEGTDHPVIHKGVITDTYKQYSDNLLMFRLKKLNPAYKDNQQVNVNIDARSVQAVMDTQQASLIMDQLRAALSGAGGADRRESGLFGDAGDGDGQVVDAETVESEQS